MRPTIKEREVGVAVQLDVWVHDRIGRPMLLAWPGWWISDATFAARAKTRFESSSPARASSSVTSASSCATRSFTPKARQPRGRHLFEVKSRAGRTLPAGSATFFKRTATRRSLATKIGDCQPFDGRDKLVQPPKETFEGSGTSRKAGAGAQEASRRVHFFFRACPAKHDFQGSTYRIPFGLDPSELLALLP